MFTDTNTTYVNHIERKRVLSKQRGGSAVFIGNVWLEIMVEYFISYATTRIEEKTFDEIKVFTFGLSEVVVLACHVERGCYFGVFKRCAWVEWEACP